MVRARVRTRAFQKTPFTFHKGAGKAVCKGVCGLSAPFRSLHLPFTYPSHGWTSGKNCSKLPRPLPFRVVCEGSVKPFGLVFGTSTPRKPLYTKEIHEIV